MIRALVTLAALALTACVSTTSSTSKPGGDPSLADARRRSEIHTVLAGEYYSRGAYAVALMETQLAIKDDQTYMPAWNMQGLIYMELRDNPNARESFERALRYAPENPEVLNNYGWFLCVHNQHARGLELLNKALANPLYPTPEKSLMSAGICTRKAGNLVEAESYLRRAVSIRPDLIGALYNLAEITFARGAAKDADAYITRYMRVANPNAEALHLAVKIARANGDGGAEQSYLQQMRRLFPDAPQTRDALDRK